MKTYSVIALLGALCVSATALAQQNSLDELITRIDAELSGSIENVNTVSGWVRFVNCFGADSAAVSHGAPTTLLIARTALESLTNNSTLIVVAGDITTVVSDEIISDLIKSLRAYAWAQPCSMREWGWASWYSDVWGRKVSRIKQRAIAAKIVAICLEYPELF